MTLALALLLAYMNAAALPEVKAGWSAPALDPRLLTAVVLTVAELTIVTAIALFFSTFSSPLLSALLTFGLWVAGHFNQDLRNFESVVNAPAVAWIMRGLYICCRTWRRSTSGRKPFTAWTCRPATCS